MFLLVSAAGVVFPGPDCISCRGVYVVSSIYIIHSTRSMFEFVLNVALLVSSVVTGLFFVVPYLFLHWKTFKNRFLFSGVINYPNKKVYIVCHLISMSCLPHPNQYWMRVYKTGFRIQRVPHLLLTVTQFQDKFLHEPERFGLEKTTHHSIPVERGRVNLWVAEPLTSSPANIVVFYCHGASSNRGTCFICVLFSDHYCGPIR